ncbi:(5-formylfuran-3-yl)methyl phosphate synthase [Moorella sulfitireducens (nom. illeg.)]|uniref:(5-formylfuran-3-yl)methyl phosphate synthase n=1 Tax=Neomoorella sulfitireducens TaxID=2972948 RepID=UPI0021ACC770|nr:(5-formylfuran-3-yl)methyl phosphate synthase [Moorella sulfitireducens]
MDSGKQRHHGPRLLVSVINLDEAVAASRGGADIVDIKNPAEGPLGAPSPQVTLAICRHLQATIPISVALGEFPGKPCAAALASLGAATCGPDYLKIGFPGSTLPREILATLKEITRGLVSCFPTPPGIVAVAYADTLASASWTLEQFTMMAREGGATGCLVDTWEKNGTSLIQILSREQICDFIDNCHRQELLCGLAGSVQPGHLSSLAQLGPDIIGIRAAACGGDRLRGRVTAARVSYLKTLLFTNLDPEAGISLLRARPF